MPGSKPGALPLGYTPKLVSPEGFEPPARGLEGRCSIQLSYEPVFIAGGKAGIVERMMRIELTPSAWKAEVLPLNYIRLNLSILRIALLLKAFRLLAYFCTRAATQSFRAALSTKLPAFNLQGLIYDSQIGLRLIS